MEINLLTICYLLASVSFILGLKMLSAPETARNGNLIAAVGMGIAILATIFLYEDDGHKLGNYPWIFSGLVVGGIIGVLAAKKVKMTAMPELVSLFNGMGGACAMLISIEEYNHLGAGSGSSAAHLLIILAGMVIGSVSFAGSVVAWGKLNGKVKDFAFPGQHLVNIGFLLLILAVSGYLLYNFNDPGFSYGNITFYLILVDDHILCAFNFQDGHPVYG